jgi:hypothetical protein
MPFTPSHAAAAWPLSKVLPRLPVAALVAGTLAPDLEYFYWLEPTGRNWHYLPWFFVSVPVGLVTWLLWRQLVRPALGQLIAVGDDRRFVPAPLTAGEIAAAIVAVTIGAVSHVVWDGFTHKEDWAVMRLPFLQGEVIPGLRLRWYKLLQHGSTILGGLSLFAWAFLVWQRQPDAARRLSGDQLRRVVRVVVAVAVAGAVGTVLNALRAPRVLGAIVGYGAVGGMLAVILFVVAWSLTTLPPMSRTRN